MKRGHSLHRMSTHKLNALTVVHNYFTKRSDETTVAERFFGQKHRAIFEYLFSNMPIAARAATKRSQPQRKPT